MQYLTFNPSKRSMEQGQADRPEATPQAQVDLGDPDSTPAVNRIEDLALFNLAIDSKPRSCDLVKLRVSDVAHGARVGKRAMVMQKKRNSLLNLKLRSSLATLSAIG